jgi:hypothetical protein
LPSATCARALPRRRNRAPDNPALLRRVKERWKGIGDEQSSTTLVFPKLL